MKRDRQRILIIGAGIVGLATGYRLLQQAPHLALTIIDKEPAVGRHQSGHNSGVIHSGIYYKPGSLKAINCRRGRAELIEFCRLHGIRHELCGKVIAATVASEGDSLRRLYQRGLEHGIDCRRIERSELNDLEPHCGGIEGIQVDDAGIVDFPAVCKTLATEIEAMGGTFCYNERVVGLSNQPDWIVVETDKKRYEVDLLINCAGLYSDRIAALESPPPCSIVPFRGEYYLLKPEYRHLCRNLIYPVPDPAFPFLGVHLTRRVNGDVECGPNAVLAFAREGYRRRDIHLRELAMTLSNRSFLQLASKHWKMGMGEYLRSFSKRAFVKALQKLLPEIREEHLLPAPAGVRAQALGKDGQLIDDFLIQRSHRAVHVCNAPSPAATACLSIGRQVAKAALD